MNVFQIVAAIMKDVDALVVGANRCDEAYANGIGHPKRHVPFGAANYRMVGKNVAGIFAASQAAQLMALQDNGTVNEQDYLAALAVYRDGTADAYMTAVALTQANLAWQACQVFLGLPANPYERFTQPNFVPFAILPPLETEKDLHTIRTAATWLLEEIKRRQALGAD